MLIVKFTVRMLQSCINLISDKIKNSLNVPETFRVQLIAEGFFVSDFVFPFSIL